MGGIVVGPLEFERASKKYSKNPGKCQKPADVIVWSEGEGRILDIAEKCSIPTVGPKWLSEYTIFYKV